MTPDISAVWSQAELAEHLRSLGWTDQEIQCGGVIPQGIKRLSWNKNDEDLREANRWAEQELEDARFERVLNECEADADA